MATLRVAIGIVMLFAPTRVMRMWLGAGAEGPAARALTRSVAGRDLALGLGALAALRRSSPLRGWVQGGALADAVDVTATLVGWRRLSPVGRVILVLSSGSAAIIGGRLAATI